VKTVFANEAEFADWRNQVASLLLVPADVNRSLQDKPFTEKKAHYARQNFWAASLDASTYQHQPKFTNFATDNILPFKPFENFTKAEQSERRVLLNKMVEMIWSPSRLEKAAHG
jgi:hypothetical protein